MRLFGRKKRTLEQELWLSLGRLRFATINALNYSDGDMGLVEDVIGEAYYNWMAVNR